MNLCTWLLTLKSVFFQITTPKEAFRKTWSAKYTLRSHFDGVRALAFHPTEPVLITASEDQTLKLWNLQKTVPAKKSAALDVEPVYTFRYLTSVAIVIQKGLGNSTVRILKPWINQILCYWPRYSDILSVCPDTKIPLYGDRDPYGYRDPSVLCSEVVVGKLPFYLRLMDLGVGIYSQLVFFYVIRANVNEQDYENVD